MPRRRQSGLDVLDDAIETAVGTLFDKGAEYIGQIREQQTKRLSPEAKAQTYVCAACRKGFQVGQMEMVNPNVPFGMCKGCFAFVWKAGEEKVKYLARKAAETRRDQPPPAPMKPPWETLGITADATVEEIRKAYRALAAKAHPDLVPPGAPAAEREAARLRFEELTRARDAMLKVRQPASGPTE